MARFEIWLRLPPSHSRDKSVLRRFGFHCSIMDKLCQVCGEPYVTRSCRSKYCSNRCKCAAKKAAAPGRYRAYRRGYYHRNKAASRQRMAKWRANNRTKYRMQSKAYRARKRKAYVESCVGWARVMTSPLVRKPCYYCGDESSGYQYDHFVPLAKGGLHAEWNMRLACPRCNGRKSARLPESIFCEEIFKYNG